VVVGTYGGAVSLVNTVSRRDVKRIEVGGYPVAVAIAP